MASPHQAYLLTGAQLADGTGTPLHASDVLIEAGHITAVQPPEKRTQHLGQAKQIDLSGLVLAPGFIDVHSHADNAPFLGSPTQSQPEAATTNTHRQPSEPDTTKIAQGVTTEIVGNCGFSLAPRSQDTSPELARFLQRLFPPVPFTGHTMAELFTATDAAGSVTNYCPLVGHSTLRIAAMGMRNGAPTAAQLRSMQRHLSEALEAGAWGLSSGLVYAPAVFSDTDELRELATVMSGAGLYVTHLRDEAAELLEALAEALEIGQIAGSTHISHLKAAGPPNWGLVPQALKLLDRNRDEGIDSAQDVYPYLASSTMLTTVLPPEFLVGSTDDVLTRLTEPSVQQRIHAALDSGRPGWENAGGGWDRVLIASTATGAYVGHTLAEIAENSATDPVSVLLNVLVSQQLNASMVNFSMHDDDLRAALEHPNTMIGSDGLPPPPRGKPHPRLFGTFPRVLARYTQPNGPLTLAEAVRRMTSLPAERFGIPDRGAIRPGAVADLVAFDPERIRDTGDYLDPAHTPEGINHVWLGGQLALHNGQHTGLRAGQRLRRAA